MSMFADIANDILLIRLANSIKTLETQPHQSPDARLAYHTVMQLLQRESDNQNTINRLEEIRRGK